MYHQQGVGLQMRTKHAWIITLQTEIISGHPERDCYTFVLRLLLEFRSGRRGDRERSEHRLELRCFVVLVQYAFIEKVREWAVGYA